MSNLGHPVGRVSPAEKKGKKKKIVVIGAGVGGITVSALLSHYAQDLFDITVLEKNDFTGGRCSIFEMGGYRFDTGPSLLLLPQTFHRTFRLLSTTLAEQGIDLFKCEPNYIVHFADGERVTLSTDLSRMKTEIERFEGTDGFERYLSWMQESHRHYELSSIHVLRKVYPSVVSLLRPSFLRYLFTLHPFTSLYTRASVYFLSERLRRAFTFGSMYMGMSPFDAPGTYSLLQYTELAEGIWYPRGGMWRVMQALEDLAKRKGVEVKLDSPVQKVTTTSDGKKTTGVLLEDGTKLEADVVIMNADLVYAYEHLLPPSPSVKLPSLRKRALSCSSVSIYLALSEKIPQLGTHNVFLADAYRESFDDIFKNGRGTGIPTELSFYVNVPSRVDATALPQDMRESGKGEAIVVLVPVGHLPHDARSERNATEFWESRSTWILEQVVHTLKTRLTPVLSPSQLHALTHPLHRRIITPLQWRDAFNLPLGSILGISHDFFNVLSFRHQAKHPDIDGCWFVGAGAHPGTGVPIVMSGAILLAESILEQEGRVMGTEDRVKKQKVRRLDVEKGTVDWRSLAIFLPLMLLSVVLPIVWKLRYRLDRLDEGSD